MRQKWVVYAAPKPSMHRPFKKNLIKINFEKKNFEKKTRTYEMSQSCDRVHLGHLKKQNFEEKKIKKN